MPDENLLYVIKGAATRRQPDRPGRACGLRKLLFGPGGLGVAYAALPWCGFRRVAA